MTLRKRNSESKPFLCFEAASPEEVEAIINKHANEYEPFKIEVNFTEWYKNYFVVLRAFKFANLSVLNFAYYHEQGVSLMRDSKQNVN